MRRAGDDGSVLIDALVAVGVLTVTLALAGEAVGDSAKRTRQAEAHRLAALEAASRMAEVGADIAASPGESQGVDGALVWSIDISPSGEGAATDGTRLLDVKVVVADSGGHTLSSLHSLRVGAQ
jgi:hypothetical protein